MADGLKKNLSVLKDQARHTRRHIIIDLNNVKSYWRSRRYMKAAHTLVFGPPAEVFEHFHRGVYYAFLVWLAIKVIPLIL